MAAYNFVYFDLRGRGESTRILLALSEAPHTEERIKFIEDEWLPFKRSGRCPFGQLPILELGDGKTICQSSAILRFLAKELGFSPNNSYECACADMIVDAMKDMEDKFNAYYWESDKDRKAKLHSSLFEEIMPKQMEFLNKLLKVNNGGKGYFVGDKMTYADINVFAFINGYIARGALEVPDMLKSFPLLVDLYNRVMNHSKILAYLKKRKPNPDYYPY